MPGINRIIAMVGFLFVLMVATGCTREPYAIEFKDDVIDFGTAEEGTEVTVVFEFKNKGSENLEIAKIHTTCGCTTPENWDKFVAPGKKGRIPVIFDTQRYQGEISKIINIETNIPGGDNIPLTLKGVVTSPIQIFPRSSWLGEFTDETQPIEGRFTLTNNKNTPINEDDIILPDENTTFALSTQENGKEYRLLITIHPPFELYETVRKTLKVKTGSTEESAIEAYYSYMIPPPVKISPGRVVIDQDRLKREEIKQRVNIKSYIDEPIGIFALEFDGPEGILQPVDALNEGNFYQIPLRFPKGFVFSGDIDGYTLSFRVQNDPRDLLYRIPVVGYQSEK